MGRLRHVLTPLGTIMLERLHGLWPTVDRRTGDLTAGGTRQWETYAAKLCREYPEVISAGATVQSQSTNVMRTARSMEAFNSALSRICRGCKNNRRCKQPLPHIAQPICQRLPHQAAARRGDALTRRALVSALAPVFVESRIDLHGWLATIFTQPRQRGIAV